MDLWNFSGLRNVQLHAYSSLSWVIICGDDILGGWGNVFVLIVCNIFNLCKWMVFSIKVEKL